MFLRNSDKYYPVELCQIISGDGSVIYDRNKRRCAFCYVDLRTDENIETER